jgi:hypothetical protein
MGNYAKLCALVACLGAAYKLYKLNEKCSVQGEKTAKVGQKPKSSGDKKENVWYKNDFELTSFDVSRPTISTKRLSLSDFIKQIEPNLVYYWYRLKNGTQFMEGRMLCLKGSVYVTNNHMFPKEELPLVMEIIQMSSKQGVTTNHDIHVSEGDIYRDELRDLIFFNLKTLPPKKDVSKYVPEASFDAKINGVYVAREYDGSMDYNFVDNISSMKESINPRNSKPFSFVGWRGRPRVITSTGFCGATLIGTTEIGYVILGIHGVLMHTDNSACAIGLDREYLEKQFKRYSQGLVVEGVRDMISSETKQRPVEDLSKKSVIRYIDEGTAGVLGSFTGFRVGGKSRVEPTILNPYLKRLGWKENYTAPAMKGWEPWRRAMIDNVNPIVNVDTSILQKCVDSYINDVTKRLVEPSRVEDFLMVLDDFTTLNGAPGVAFIDKMNRNTSAGDPFKKSKRHFLISIPPEHGMQDPVKLNEEISERIDRIYEKYVEGERAYPNFCAHLKDEAVSHEKAKIKKTRVFTGAPIDFCFIVRKYTLSFTRLIQTERLAFECATGTICQSLQWQEIGEYLTAHGDDQIVAGDYKAYDKRMSPKEILAAFEVIKHFCVQSGNYSEEDLRVLDCIAVDTAFPNVDYNGDYIELYGSNPSGNPLTVVLNSIVNSLRMRYAYHELNHGRLDDFADNVNLMTYGDDNIMGVSKNAPFYNHTAIAQVFDGMDIVYTMADKKSVSVPYIHIADADFLKRKFVYDNDVGAMLAPLDEESIEKSLMTWVRSKTISKEHQAISVISSAVREYFFHGKQKFNEKREMFIDMVGDLDLQPWVEDSTFPTWDELYNLFWKNSGKTREEHEWVEVQSSPQCLPLEYQYPDIFEYPTYQSLTNYDLSIHWWIDVHLILMIFQVFTMNCLFLGYLWNHPFYWYRKYNFIPRWVKGESILLTIIWFTTMYCPTFPIVVLCFLRMRKYY